MSRVSIKNIAQRIGVSNATVSLVLNGKEKEGRVSKEMSERIRKVALEMNYEPNSLARGLRIGKSQTIGLIVADISNTFFAHLAFHIQEYAEKYGYTVIITNTNESEEKMEKMINILKSRQVDGLIIVPTDHGERTISKLLKSKLPLVLLDRYFPDIPASHVAVNNHQASKKATEYLIQTGCKKIALLTYDNTLHHMSERKRGYMDALLEAGIYDPSLIKGISYQNINEDIIDAINDLLKSEKKVDGIFFASNSISTVGIKQIISLNLSIPDDVQVFCFDKSNDFDFSNFKVPCALQPIPEMGKKAVDLLLDQIKQKTTFPESVELLASLSNIS